jgi:hypothetical protein
MSTAGNSYEAWKEALQQAEVAGDEEWSAECGGQYWFAGLAQESKGPVAGLCLGVVLLIISAAVLLLNFRHLTQGERTVGIIVGHKDYFNGRSSTLRAPVVRYSATGGVFEVVGSLAVARSIYPIGKETSVLYLRNDPRNAVIADFVQLFLIPTVVGSLGLICLVGTAGVMFWTVRGELRGQRVSTKLPAKMTPRSIPTGSANATPSPEDSATSATSPSQTAETETQLSSVGSE